MKKILIGILSLIAVLALGTAIFLFSRPEVPPPVAETPAPTVTASVTPTPTPSEEPIPSLPPPIPEGTPEPEPEPSAPAVGVSTLTPGKWFVTPERKAYKEDSLTLYLPSIDIKRAVHNGTDVKTLNRGVGLYEYAQLPGEGNRNVSVAGHRNGLDKQGRVTDKAPFYYVDKISKGDYLYLYDSKTVYRYLYESTTVVEADDWNPIAVTEGSRLTITSCTPIGVSDHRIVVRGALDKTFPYTKDFDFLEKEEQP